MPSRSRGPDARQRQGGYDAGVAGGPLSAFRRSSSRIGPRAGRSTGSLGDGHHALRAAERCASSTLPPPRQPLSPAPHPSPRRACGDNEDALHLASLAEHFAGGDRLHRLAKSHVVGKHPAAGADEVKDAIARLRKELASEQVRLDAAGRYCSLDRLADRGSIPPPRFPLQRLSGVFGPRSPLRAAVVPRGPARAGATATLPRAKKKMAKTPDDASPFVASGEGTLPERGSDGEKAVRSRPRTSLGDGVVKPGGSRIEWAQLLRRLDRVDVLAFRCGGRRAYVTDISDREPLRSFEMEIMKEGREPRTCLRTKKRRMMMNRRISRGSREIDRTRAKRADSRARLDNRECALIYEDLSDVTGCPHHGRFPRL